MALAVEKILSDALNLSVRLKEHDITADSLIARTQSLQRQVEAMKRVRTIVDICNSVTVPVLNATRGNSRILIWS